MLAVEAPTRVPDTPGWVTKNPKMHATKPWESLGDKRKAKKAERQRKTQARRNKR